MKEPNAGTHGADMTHLPSAIDPQKKSMCNASKSTQMQDKTNIPMYSCEHSQLIKCSSVMFPCPVML